MKTRILGKTGFKVSEIGLGCWQLGGDFGPLSDALAQTILSQARAAGVTFWDTADVYGDGRSERLIAQNNRDAHAKGDVDRPVIATKLGRTAALFPRGYTKASVRTSLEGNLTRLGLDCLDLIQLHCVPPELLHDGEVFTWLSDFQREGLCRYYGASVETIDEALLCLKDPNLATLQIIFNLFRQDAVDTLLPLALEKNVGIIARLPLASGLLSGKYARDHRFSDQDHRHFNRDGEAFSVGETFSGIPFAKGVELSEQLQQFVPAGMSLAQFSLRWLLDHPAVSSVIAGVSRPDQVRSNVSASALESLPEKTHQALKTFYHSNIRPHIRGTI